MFTPKSVYAISFNASLSCDNLSDAAVGVPLHFTCTITGTALLAETGGAYNPSLHTVTTLNIEIDDGSGSSGMVESFGGHSFYFTPSVAGHYTVSVVGVTYNGSSASQYSSDLEFDVAEAPVVEETEHAVMFYMGGHGEEIPSQVVDYNGKATRPENPVEAGWTFEGWYADASLKYYFDFNTPITENTYIYGRWVKGEDKPIAPVTTESPYKCIFGENSKWTFDKNSGSNKEITIVSDAPIEKYVQTVVDGIVVPKDMLRVVSGSTRVTFLPEFLKTLAEGKHTVTIVSTDGSVNAELTINATTKTPEPTKAPEKTEKLDVTPKTGNRNYAPVFGLILLLGAAFAGTAYNKKKF